MLSQMTFHLCGFPGVVKSESYPWLFYSREVERVFLTLYSHMNFAKVIPWKTFKRELRLSVKGTQTAAWRRSPPSTLPLSFPKTVLLTRGSAVFRSQRLSSVQQGRAVLLDSPNGRTEIIYSRCHVLRGALNELRTFFLKEYGELFASSNVFKCSAKRPPTQVT